MTKNMRAFLDTIAKSEGTWGKGDDGYDVLFGGKFFESYADHPRVKAYETHDNFIKNGKKDYTTAAGRYQILARYFDVYKKQLGLKDFGKESQDAIAIQLIKECGALKDIEAGRIETAIEKCASRWASFPGANYGQRENKMANLVLSFERSGGILA
ncbi:MAG: glycoside hydrolase family 104 protein [Methylococcaceae bacterium]